jgi:tetratricopeptide (TPR) repeat protein
MLAKIEGISQKTNIFSWIFFALFWYQDFGIKEAGQSSIRLPGTDKTPQSTCACNIKTIYTYLCYMIHGISVAEQTGNSKTDCRMMKVFTRLIVLFFMLSGCAMMTPLQRSKFITVFHLIDTAKYADAKTIVEEMIEDEQSSQWPRTWYARGLLTQTAYRDGMKNNDRKKYELYPDQLFVAFESYEKALSLDTRGTVEKQLAPKYVLLANDFQEMGKRHFAGGRHKEALRAFETALYVTQSPVLTVQVDTNLIYNTALAAFESRNFEAAIEHLTRLDNYEYGANVTHLLSVAHLETGDSLAAEKVLRTGVDRYEDNNDLILLLSDLLYQKRNINGALTVLDKASAQYPDNHVFPYTKGLIYQKTEQYNEAILAYMEAVAIAPEELMIYANIATCYYNIGVEIDANSRLINSNRQVLEEKTKSSAAFDSAVIWLDKAYEKKSNDKEVVSRLSQLYRLLNILEKAQSMEEMLD